jgi:Protein of unknown function (DUF3617).
MRNTATIISAAAALGLMAAPSLGASWSFRPGLWEITWEMKLDTDQARLLEKQQAELKQRGIKLPPQNPQPMQFCEKPGNDAKSMFDPANQPPGRCSEKILSEGAAGREIEDKCTLPSENPQFFRPARAYRHLVSDSGTEIVDRAEFSSDGLTFKYRWLAADCGSVTAR